MDIGMLLACLTVAGLSCLPGGRQISKGKEVTGILLTNGNKSSSFRSILFHGAPLADEVNLSK
jgi:hypothetical protein